MAIRNKLWLIFTGGEETKSRLKQAYIHLGIMAEKIIQAAFESSGFGHWKPDSASTIARKGSSRTLIDTSQLRASITSDVVAK
jgi:SOS response regulatory protein OraA/RecX